MVSLTSFSSFPWVAGSALVGSERIDDMPYRVIAATWRLVASSLRRSRSERSGASVNPAYALKDPLPRQGGLKSRIADANPPADQRPRQRVRRHCLR